MICYSSFSGCSRERPEHVRQPRTIFRTNYLEGIHSQFNGFREHLGTPGFCGKCRILAVRRRELLANLVRGSGARTLPEIGVARAVHKVSGVVEIGLRNRSTASGELEIGMPHRSVSTAVRAKGVVRHRSISTAVKASGVLAATVRKPIWNIIILQSLAGRNISDP